MKLSRLEIKLLPGIDTPFALEDLGDGLHVVVGPNGIGKSSLCRAMTALLWKDGTRGAQVVASARFEADGGEYIVERESTSWRWRRGDVPCEAPRLPALHLSGCFFLGLRDLLDPAQNAGKDVARAIREQMSGGYNLTAVGSPFAVDPLLRRARRNRGDCSEADNSVRKAETEQKGLERREASLVQLELKISATEAARRRGAHIQAALDLHGKRLELEECQQALDALPPALEHLSGNEAKEIDAIAAELKQKREAHANAERKRAEARAAAQGARLTGPVADGLLGAAKRRAEKLGDDEGRLARAKEDQQGAQRAVAELSRRLGGHEGTPVHLSLADGEALFAFLRDLHDAQSKRSAVEDRLRLLDPDKSDRAESESQQQLERGMNQLRTWLRSPAEAAGAAPSEPSAASRLPAIFAAVLVAVGLPLGFAVNPALYLISAVGVGLALAPLMRRASQPALGSAADLRGFAQREFPRALEQPSAWTLEAVTERLQGFEDDLADLRASQQRAEYQAADRAELLVRREALEQIEAELDVRRGKLAGELGLAQIPPGVDLIDRVRAMDQLRAAHAREEESTGKVMELERQRAKLLSDLDKDLRELGEAAPSDAASARAGVESLEGRDRDLRAALDKGGEQQVLLSQLGEEIARLEGLAREVYEGARLQVEDRAGLVGLMDTLVQYKELDSNRAALQKEIDRAVKRLQGAGEEQLCTLEPDRLEQELSRVEELSEGLTGLLNEQAEIRVEVKNTREGSSLEERLAERDAALEQLEDQRERVLRAAAGKFLIDSVGAEYDKGSMPVVLQRARELFGKFTEANYELSVVPEEGASFVATEVGTGKLRQLDELSDGTRIQLALAARLAFVEQAEQGVQLPLFLDEALDHSDPQRFHAIARSLARNGQG